MLLRSLASSSTQRHFVRSRLRRARRGDRECGLGHPVRATGGEPPRGVGGRLVGSARTSGPIGRITCYSTGIWAFSISFNLALRRNARPSAVDDGRSRRAAIVEYIEKQPESPGQQPCHCSSSGAANMPDSVGQITCDSTIVCWPLCEAPAEPPHCHTLSAGTYAFLL